MVRDMPPVRNLAPGQTVIHPNRDKAVCKATKATVVFILLVSVLLMLIVTIGGWSNLQGMKPLNFAWCLVYIIIAVYIARWARGLLPIAPLVALMPIGLVPLGRTPQRRGASRPRTDRQDECE